MQRFKDRLVKVIVTSNACNMMERNMSNQSYDGAGGSQTPSPETQAPHNIAQAVLHALLHLPKKKVRKIHDSGKLGLCSTVCHTNLTFFQSTEVIPPPKTTQTNLQEF